MALPSAPHPMTPTGHTPRAVRVMRLVLAFFALLDVAAHLFASPGSTPIISYWIDIETASYGLIAVVYLLGLRRYYGPPVLFTLYNLGMYFLSGWIRLPFGINPRPLVSHVEFLTYSFGRGFSVAAWLVLLVGGWWMLRHDPGSGVNRLLED
ncbi:MAG: hypothetical protein OWQ57_03675 [Sulfobacillus sp.]|nr:hypothetical protein [Sulfobacillus sp.]